MVLVWNILDRLWEKFHFNLNWTVAIAKTAIGKQFVTEKCKLEISSVYLLHNQIESWEQCCAVLLALLNGNLWYHWMLYKHSRMFSLIVLGYFAKGRLDRHSVPKAPIHFPRIGNYEEMFATIVYKKEVKICCGWIQVVQNIWQGKVFWFIFLRMKDRYPSFLSHLMGGW